jgi:hypothetical protein
MAELAEYERSPDEAVGMVQDDEVSPATKVCREGRSGQKA